MGCLAFYILLSYIFLKWVGITDYMPGAKSGGITGLRYGVGMNFFMYLSIGTNYGSIATDVQINTLMGANTGAVITIIIGKSK